MVLFRIYRTQFRFGRVLGLVNISRKSYYNNDATIIKIFNILSLSRVCMSRKWFTNL